MWKRISLFWLVTIVFISVVSVINIYTQDKALLFDGTNDYVDFGTNTMLNITSMNATGLTIEMWVKISTTANQRLFYKYNWNVGGYDLRIEGSDGGAVYFQVATPGYARLGDAFTRISTGVWTHIAVVIDKTMNEGRIYINGILRDNGTMSMPASVNTSAYLGGGPGLPYTSGTIDEVRISNIARYSSNFSPLSVEFTTDINTIALWHFNEGTGTSTSDSSGNNITGTLVNDPTWVAGYFSSLPSNNPPSAPGGLFCNGLINPTSLADLTPYLSWTFIDPDPNNTQSAYRLLFSDNQTTLQSNIGNLWDTNKVNSSANGVTYSGQQLQYGSVYYWKVQTWDNYNSTSPFSSIATITMRATPPVTTGRFAHPYGVNSWAWPLTACQMFKDAGIDRFRVMVSWRECEKTDDVYTWQGSITDAVNRAYTIGAKVSLSVYDSPDWARTNLKKVLSYPPQKYADFCVALLQYCDSLHSGVVEAIEIENEHATGTWNDEEIPVHGTEERDPSLYYANILKTSYNAIKSYNPNIIILPCSVWSGADHFIDDLYQLGCKNYFDKLHLHYYVQGMGQYEDPTYPGSVWHYPTTIGYFKHIARENGDWPKYIWVTEFGWRLTYPDYEIKKSNYLKSVLEMSRQSGIVEMTHMYLGLTGGYDPSQNDYEPGDRAALIYTDIDWNPSFMYATTSYYMYMDIASQYPTWDPNSGEILTAIPPASSQINIINPGFELGNTSGWIGGILDSSVKHSGNYSGKTSSTETFTTQNYPAEKGKMYEIMAWLKIDAPSSTSCIVFPRIAYTVAGSTTPELWNPPNYWGLVDTRNYPNGWRRIRYKYYSFGDNMSIQFNSSGVGTYWVDDLTVKPLSLLTDAVINVNPSVLEFGEIEIGNESTLSFIITNSGTGTLNGTITADKDWIIVLPTSFNGNTIVVNVTVDNNILNAGEGEHTGNIYITSNGGNASVTVKFTATCVLVKPNPYNPEKGPLTFFGSGIVPRETTIKIYTLSGELVKEITAPHGLAITTNNELTWDGKNESGKPVPDGIYLYTYKSPKEKGIGKFTVIIK